MSFGYSIGDLVATVQLADEIKKRFAQAPGEFIAISTQLNDLSALLGQIHTGPGVSSSEGRWNQLQSAVSRSYEVLREIEDALKKDNVLASASAHLNWKNRVVKAWKRIRWDSEQVNRWQSRLASCVSMLQLILEQMNLEMTWNVSSRVAYMSGNMSTLITANQSVQHDTLLAWICPSNGSERHRKTVDVRARGTGQWFLEDKQFLAWDDSEKSTTLLCTGVPGAGKTIIASIAIDYLRQKFMNDENTTVSYFYFDFRHLVDLSDILSSLLKELLQGQGRTAGFQGTARLSNRYLQNSSRMSREEVSEHLRDTISSFKETFFVIDALDECLDARVRRQFLEWAKNAMENHNLKIKLLVTARYNDDFGDSFLSRGRSMDIKAKRDDMEVFLNESLAYLPSFIRRNMDLWHHVRQEIVNSAGDMFLLVRLHLNLLMDEKNEKNVRAFTAKLQAGSGAYDAAYGEIMSRIGQQSPSSQELAKRSLGWLAFSTRPLTATDLQQAIAIEIGHSQFDEDNIVDIEEIVSACFGLIAVDKSTNEATLIHFTTQEYLARMFNSWHPGIYEYLTDACLTYLSLDRFGSGLVPLQSLEQSNQPTLYRHAALELGTRLDQSKGNRELLLRLFEDEAKVSRCMQVICGGGYGFVGLHLASALGVEEIIAESSLRGSHLDILDHFGRTPLIWAASCGHDAVARLLLERGANPNSSAMKGYTPLSYAAASGHVEVARTLIQSGADINYRNQDGDIPLFVAIKSTTSIHNSGPLFHDSDRLSVIQLLLDANVETDSVDEIHKMALYLAAENGNEPVVKMLLDRMGSLNANDYRPPSFSRHGQDDAWQTGTPLEIAARQGHVKVVKRLLTSSADTGILVHTSTLPVSFYALSTLVGSGSTDDEAAFAELLVESGSSAFQDDFRRLPLHWAASRGDHNLVHKMVKAGVDPNCKDIFGRTPLFAAACRRQYAVVKSLLDHASIDVRCVDIFGFTAWEESYRREQYHDGTDTDMWHKISNLLHEKCELQGTRLPDSARPFSCFGRMPQMRFTPHCDVCLDVTTLWSPGAKTCVGCSAIYEHVIKDGAKVKYCSNCIGNAEHCPLCGQLLKLGL